VRSAREDHIEEDRDRHSPGRTGPLKHVKEGASICPRGSETKKKGGGDGRGERGDSGPGKGKDVES